MDTSLLNSENEQFKLFHLEMETSGQKVQTLRSPCISVPFQSDLGLTKLNDSSMDDYSQAEINIAVNQFREYCIEVLFKTFSEGQ